MAASDTLASYPWYVSDWRGSKMRISLSTAGRGMYRELLDYCWEIGYLPSDERSLIAISGGSKAEFKREWDVMKAAFFEQDGVLKHHKVEEKREKLVHFRETRRSNASGKRGAVASADAIAKASAPANGDAIGGPSFLPPSSPFGKEHISPSPMAPGGGVDLDPIPVEGRDRLFSIDPVTPKQKRETLQRQWFDQWWATVWLKVGKDGAWTKFKQKITTQELFEKVMQQTAAQGPSFIQRERDKQPHPETWISKGRYTDDLSGPVYAESSKDW